MRGQLLDLQPITHDRIEQHVLQLQCRLEAAGFETWLVGGSVRDLLLGKRPKDWDLVTQATPDEVRDILSDSDCRVLKTGLRYGTQTVLMPQPVDVATMRQEQGYLDKRRPDVVRFVRDIGLDLARRDFTINALAWHPALGLRDDAGGLVDLAHRMIRTVGNQDDRFAEDALRILRDLRFAAVLGGSVESTTAASIREHADMLHYVSMERIVAELSRMLPADGAADILEGFWSIIACVLPIVKTYDGEKRARSIRAFKNAPDRDLTLSLALLLEPVDDVACIRPFLSSRRFTNQTSRDVCLLLGYARRPVPQTDQAIKVDLRDMGATLFHQRLRMWRALERSRLPEDIAAAAVNGCQREVDGDLFMKDDKQESLSAFDRLEEQAARILSSGEPYTLAMLAVCGSDIRRLGVTDGVRIGDLLERLLFDVMADPTLNEKEHLLERARHYTTC